MGVIGLRDSFRRVRPVGRKSTITASQPKPWKAGKHRPHWYTTTSTTKQSPTNADQCESPRTAKKGRGTLQRCQSQHVHQERPIETRRCPRFFNFSSAADDDDRRPRRHTEPTPTRPALIVVVSQAQGRQNTTSFQSNSSSSTTTPRRCLHGPSLHHPTRLSPQGIDRKQP
jgi:hypothetical protein